mmetsp:Transcript_8020/g.15925  ORF Transcript_8020/g.15925 Transcript_8020/m.15925 type:complete len:209 (-) Transcript_8020:169-795(-)
MCTISGSRKRRASELGCSAVARLVAPLVASHLISAATQEPRHLLEHQTEAIRERHSARNEHRSERCVFQEVFAHPEQLLAIVSGKLRGAASLCRSTKMAVHGSTRRGESHGHSGGLRQRRVRACFARVRVSAARNLGGPAQTGGHETENASKQSRQSKAKQSKRAKQARKTSCPARRGLARGRASCQKKDSLPAKWSGSSARVEAGRL